VEVFHLSDAANAAIPADIRQQFHRDDYGRVLFFATPPLDPVAPTQQGLGHSFRYLAAKEERKALLTEKKRKEAQAQQEYDTSTKRVKAEKDAFVTTKMETLMEKAVNVLAFQMSINTEEFYKLHYGDDAPIIKTVDNRRWTAAVMNEQLGFQREGLKKSSPFISLKGSGVFLDDID
jgi:chromatin structure-remodeling complex subunit RSC1/2